MRRISILLMALLLLAGAAWGQGKTSAKVDPKQLLTGDFQIVWRVRDLSEGVQKILLHNFNAAPKRERDFFRIADSGEPFSAGCTGNEPHTRLIYAGVAKDTVFVYLEHGGYAHYMTVAVYWKNDKGIYTEIWSGYMRRRANTLDDLRRQVAQSVSQQ